MAKLKHMFFKLFTGAFIGLMMLSSNQLLRTDEVRSGGGKPDLRTLQEIAITRELNERKTIHDETSTTTIVGLSRAEEDQYGDELHSRTSLASTNTGDFSEETKAHAVVGTTTSAGLLQAEEYRPVGEPDSRTLPTGGFREETNTDPGMKQRIMAGQIERERLMSLLVGIDDSLQSTRADAGTCLQPRLSREQCESKYGERKFLSADQTRLPPLLYSFPGSGNTWVRLLIEYATNIFSGSVYDDEELAEVMPGEYNCSWQVSVVKAHPHTHSLQSLIAGTFLSDNNKCKDGGVKQFKRVIVLVRNPFDSIWSEHTRSMNKQHGKNGSHVLGFTKEDFNYTAWTRHVAKLGYSYSKMWPRDLAVMEHLHQSGDVLFVKYENLKDAYGRTHELTKIIDFLNRSEGSHSDIEADSSDGSECTGVRRARNEHIACAFILAESPKVHRSMDPSIKHRYVDKATAFTFEISCAMWRLFGQYAREFGYRAAEFHEACPTGRQFSILESLIARERLLDHRRKCFDENRILRGDKQFEVRERRQALSDCVARARGRIPTPQGMPPQLESPWTRLKNTPGGFSRSAMRPRGPRPRMNVPGGPRGRPPRMAPRRQAR